MKLKLQMLQKYMQLQKYVQFSFLFPIVYDLFHPLAFNTDIVSELAPAAAPRAAPGMVHSPNNVRKQRFPNTQSHANKRHKSISTSHCGS